PQTPPVTPPPRAGTGLNEQLRKKLADQILNNKNLNLNTLIQRLQQIRANRLNRQRAASAPGQTGIGAGQRGQGRGRDINRAGRGVVPGQGQGRGAGNLGQGLGPGKGQGQGAGNLGQGLGPGQGQGRGAGNVSQGLGPGQGQGRGAGNVGRRLGQGLGRGAANVNRGRGQGRVRGIGNVGRGLVAGVGRGFNLRLRDGSCLYLELQRPGARAGLRNIPPTRGRSLGAGARLGRGSGRGAGAIGRGRGLGREIIRDEQLSPEDELLEQLEQLNEQELNQVLEEIQQIK
ncbi:hypothetical protein ACFL02_10395, partial [Planctomycetota bacterium]